MYHDTMIQLNKPLLRRKQVRRKFFFLVSMVVGCLMASSVWATNIVGTGSQLRGNPGRNAQLNGKVFNVPKNGAISNVSMNGTDSFWIERANGQQLATFGSMQQAIGYPLPAGSYRVLPNLRENPKAQSSTVSITVTYP